MQNTLALFRKKELFDYSLMDPKKKKEFDEWYAEKQLKVYNLKDELDLYCTNDVLVLRECCKITQKSFEELFPGIQCFEQPTNPSAVMLGFQVHFLAEKCIGIMPSSGYGSRHNQSNKALEWMAHMERISGVKIQTCRSPGGEKRIKQFPVDGWDPVEKTVYQFHGCFWHGCAIHFPDPSRMNTVRMKTFGEIREETVKTNLAIQSDPNVQALVIKYECEFDQEKKAGMIKSLKFRPRLDVRGSLVGGRTEVFSLYESIQLPNKGKTYDVISLYPSVMVFGEFPIGHPEIVLHDFDYDISRYFGVVHCVVLPPANLFIPTLPLRLPDGRIVYTLCRQCSIDINIAFPCGHDDSERMFEGAWTTPMLNQAVLDGYKIVEIFEVHHFGRTSKYNPLTKEGGIFAEFILSLIRKKIVNSGFPSSVLTDEEKLEYCNQYEKTLGIVFAPEEVVDNPGLRYCAKIAANSTWGRYVMRPLFQQNKYCKTYQEMRDVVFNSQFDTKDIRLLVLLKAMRIKNEDTLYCDTDSIFFISRHGVAEPPIGNIIGDFSDELNGKHFVEWAALGKKSYCQVLSDGEQRMKCKGIPKTHRLRENVNMAVMKDILFGSGPPTVVACNELSFKRNMENLSIQNVNLTRRVS
ncbi:uncharacterized protein LOC129588733 [Paramacrobiotus metropolitanus]|uniref:uncharacterized protein LOC129588733 n=1 Tax=Paramacrobiotus metropolitanus TaxID=2943436 RepID=UPI002445808A|nr:uncharacterized protein LOC129588733 [Paramacrobiotus metropolitanus]